MIDALGSQRDTATQMKYRFSDYDIPDILSRFDGELRIRGQEGLVAICYHK